MNPVTQASATKTVVNARGDGPVVEGPELERGEEAEEDVREEAGGPGYELPRQSQREPAAGGGVRVSAGRRAVWRGWDARSVEKGAAAAGDHVERRADRASLVVVQVPAEVEHLVRLEAEVAGVQHGQPRRIPLGKRQRRIRSQEHEPGLGPLRAALDEEGPLAEVQLTELAVHTPQLEPRRQRQRPVRGFLHRGVASQGKPRDAVNRPPPGDRAHGVDRGSHEVDGSRQLVEVELPDEGGTGPIPGPSLVRGVGAFGLPVRQHADHGFPAEEPGEPVQAVVPVVVPRDTEQDAPVAARPGLVQHLVPGLDHSPQDLPAGSHGIGGVAAEEEDVAARQGLLVVTVRRGVLGEDQARDRGAQVAVVPGVGDEVDPHRTLEALGEGRRVGHRCPQNPRGLVQELVRPFWTHPVSRVHRLAGDGRGGYAADVAQERCAAEPADGVRRMGSAMEPGRRIARPAPLEGDGRAGRRAAPQRIGRWWLAHAERDLPGQPGRWVAGAGLRSPSSGLPGR